MREAKFLAGLATVFFFAGIFFFKALSDKKISREQGTAPVPAKPSTKIALVLLGSVSFAISLLLCWRCYILLQ